MSGYPGVILVDSPRGYWRLNELVGTVAIDSSGIAMKNGVYSGGVVLGDAGPMDDAKAAHFDGSTGYAEVTNFPMSATFTVECWVRSDPAAWNDYGFILSSRSNNGFIFHPTNPGATTAVGFYILTSTGGAVLLGDRLIGSGIQKWNHLAFTYNAVTGAHTIVINGVEEVSATNLQTRTDTNITLDIGKDHTLARFLDGSMAEVAIYPYVLTLSQIQAHYYARPASVRYRADNNTSIYSAVKA